MPEILKSLLYSCDDNARLRTRKFQMTGSLGKREAIERAADGDNNTLNFKVSLDFKKEFKGFAGSEGITMTELLKEGFALSKQKRQK